MKIRIAGIVNDSIVDGPGLRLAVFTQGCFRNCEGCHNPETHNPFGGQEIDIYELTKRMLENPLLDGLTISGGEPFLQAAECANLAKEAHKLGLNVWVYTGYLYEDLTSSTALPEWQDLLDETDVLVDGPFIFGKRSLKLKFCGSSNQRLIDMNRTRENGQITLLGDI